MGQNGGKPAAAAGSEGNKNSKLANLLKPKKSSENWIAEAGEGKDGEDITEMFMDVQRSVAPPVQGINAADFEETSLDRIIPSVCIDKFLQASDVLQTSVHLGVLLGHEQKFGKGAKRFKRHVVTTMICGWFKQIYDLEPWTFTEAYVYFLFAYIFVLGRSLHKPATSQDS